MVALAASCLRRLGLLEASVPVVLGGGVLQGGDPRLMTGIERGLAAVAPLARPTRVSVPPVVGAVLLALQHQGAPASVLEAARGQVSARYA
ncbi:hypothetical protein [Micropruina sonneratiae]|uniref:hypothetical protein n=1 Tax=Micropruina sonneratiae TaxID=2986940 RepID=UPI0022271FBC|nr:hypothetical protein [Micropruina sp. KQZ13P-5]MCW3158667.1 hypothetical protein [Micropruina sp. KQZ13P-5]